VESLRHNSVIHDIETVPDVEFHSATEIPEALPGSLGYVQLLWDKRSLFYRVATRALAVSLVVAFLIPTRYESTVSVMPPDSFGNGAMLAALAEKAKPGLASMAGNLLGMKNTGALFVNLLSSRTVQDHLVDNFHLQKVYGTRYKQDARKILAERTVIDEERKSGVITVVVTDRSPQRARDMAQAYVEELDRLVSQVSTSSARRERIFIEQRLDSVKNDLEDAEKQFSAFASKNTALDIKEQTKAMVESAAILQGQIIATQSELQGLEQIYTDNNVRVRSLRAQLAELKLQAQKIGGTDASLGIDPTKSDDLYPSIRKLPLLGVQWADLYRRMKIQETVYELLNQQYELTRIQEAKEIPTVNVIDPANVPERKSYPPRVLIALVLTTISLTVTAAWIVASARWQKVDPRDPRRLFAMGASNRIQQWGRDTAIRSRLDRVNRWLERSRHRST
jgi:capsule polysaccharide export protein KpsE/RkpR